MFRKSATVSGYAIGCTIKSHGLFRQIITAVARDVEDATMNLI